MTTLGQLSFDGREVQGIYLEIPGFGRVEFPADETLHVDDVLECTVRYRIAYVSHGAKGDGRGLAKESFSKTYVGEAVKPSLQVTAIVSEQVKAVQA